MCILPLCMREHKKELIGVTRGSSLRTDACDKIRPSTDINLPINRRLLHSTSMSSQTDYGRRANNSIRAMRHVNTHNKCICVTTQRCRRTVSRCDNYRLLMNTLIRVKPSDWWEFPIGIGGGFYNLSIRDSLLKYVLVNRSFIGFCFCLTNMQ